MDMKRQEPPANAGGMFGKQHRNKMVLDAPEDRLLTKVGFSVPKKIFKLNITSMLISIILMLSYKLLTIYNLYQKITYPIQLITINLIYFLQSLFGIDVFTDNFNLIYVNSLNVEISSICVGIEQLIFFFFMISFFVGVNFKIKIRGFLFFTPIIIITNLIRLFLIYPLSVVYSIETAWKIHDFIFIYGQGFFLLLLVIIWYFVFVKRKSA